ncbi:MAG: hypothetical protein ACI83D_000546 [Planctomycetota bacterium]|jgi:hypothetical protein
MRICYFMSIKDQRQRAGILFQKSLRGLHMLALSLSGVHVDPQSCGFLFGKRSILAEDLLRSLVS